MSLESGLFRLTEAQFSRVSQLVYQLSGITLKEGKEELVENRLAKRMRSLKLTTFDDYWKLLQQNPPGPELSHMIDALTTNKTSFFREPEHMDFFRDVILPSHKESGRSLKVWSAGCSSGEEPYTIAMVIREAWPECDRHNVRILATDLSADVLSRAKEGSYEGSLETAIPRDFLVRYFQRAEHGSGVAYKVTAPLRKMVTFARLNLMDSWPMKGPFDVIFCRNVMIYFDKPTQSKLVSRFCQLLHPGGHLIVGHSESLTSSAAGLRYVRPATYEKV